MERKVETIVREKVSGALSGMKQGITTVVTAVSHLSIQSILPFPTKCHASNAFSSVRPSTLRHAFLCRLTRHCS